MALTIKGRGLSFGISAVASGDTLTTAEASESFGVQTTLRDLSGKVVAERFGSPRATIHLEGYGSISSAPSLGSTTGAGGESAVVVSRGVKASNEDFVRYVVEANSAKL